MPHYSPLLTHVPASRLQSSSSFFVVLFALKSSALCVGAMPRFKAHIRDGRRKLADLEVEARRAAPQHRQRRQLGRPPRRACAHAWPLRRCHKLACGWRRPRPRRFWGAWPCVRASVARWRSYSALAAARKTHCNADAQCANAAAAGWPAVRRRGVCAQTRCVRSPDRCRCFPAASSLSSPSSVGRTLSAGCVCFAAAGCAAA